MLQASVCYRILAHTAEPCQFIRIIEANLVQNGPLGDNFHNIKWLISLQLMCRWMSAGSHRHYIHIWRRWSCCFFAIILYGLFAFWGNIKTPYAVKTLSNASLIQCFNQCNKLFMEMFFFRIWWSSSIKVCILWCKSQLIGRFPVMSSKNLVASSCSNCEFQDKPSSASYRFVSSHKLTPK